MTSPTSDFNGVTVADDWWYQTGGPEPMSSAPCGGTVKFSPINIVTHLGDGVTVVPEDITAVVDATTGHMEQFLLATNDPQYEGSNVYQVTFALTRQGRAVKKQPDTYTLTLPAALIGTKVRLRTLLPYGGGAVVVTPTTPTGTYAGTY